MTNNFNYTQFLFSINANELLGFNKVNLNINKPFFL